MIKRIIPFALLGISLVNLSACNSNGFKKTKHGLEYRIVKDAAGKNNPKPGDIIELFIVDKVGDSIMFDSRKMRGNEPLQIQMPDTSGQYGDVSEGLAMMTPGDSALFHIQLDSFRKKDPKNFPVWIKKGAIEEYRVVLVSIKSKEQAQKEMQEKMMAEQQKTQAESARQIEIDDKILQDYFAKNNLKPTKTASGLYYIIEKQGAGELPKQGDQVSVNYTGRLLDGKVFDSNQEADATHKDPFTFPVGEHQVIPGWDEGLMLMKKGAKAKLFIPSPLAYGPNAQGPIPANGVLMFDITVLDIKSKAVK